MFCCFYTKVKRLYYFYELFVCAYIYLEFNKVLHITSQVFNRNNGQCEAISERTIFKSKLFYAVTLGSDHLHTSTSFIENLA